MSAEAPSIVDHTIESAAAALRAGQTTAVRLVEGVFARIERLDAQLGAFVSTFRDAADDAAELADRELARGYDRGPLHGIPLAIKDIIATVEGPTRANSLVPAPNWEGRTDATAVSRLRDAGAIVVGKATTSEFALGLHDPSKGFPSPRNPWDTDRFAGGSSSGTAIAIAAGLAAGGLGSDSGGSIRHPAALNGITGLKVSYGRVPTTGVVPLAETLDTVGPMAHSAYDCALLLQVIAGHDANDPSSRRIAVPNYVDALDGELDDVRIGRPSDYFFDGDNVHPAVSSAVTDALAVLTTGGARVSDVSLPHADMAKVANQIVIMTEAFAYHRDGLADRWFDYGVHTRDVISRGALYGAMDYIHAKRIAALFTREVVAAMRDCDVLVMPTMPAGAALLAEATDRSSSKRWTSGSFTGQWNLAGLPACAVPVGFDDDGMPVSMQIVGRPFDEATVLRVADAYQRRTAFHLARPPLIGGTNPAVRA